MKTWIIALGVCVTAQLAQAEVYHYVNEEGRKIYVDRKSQIPPQYRDQVVVKRELRSSRKMETAEPPATGEEAGGSVEEQIASMEAYMRKLETPVEIRGNSVLVPVKVTFGRRYTTLKLILDTGATSTIIHEDALKGLGIGSSKGGKAQVAGGGVIDTRNVRLDRFEVGPYSLTSVTAGVITHEQPGQYDGLLGMDFLRSVKYDIDFDRSLVIWERDKYEQARRDLEELQKRLQAASETEGSETAAPQE